MQQRSDSPENPDSNVGKQFGDLMREGRERKGWSQRQLAEALQTVELRLDPSAITRIERGSRDVKLTEAIAIASVLEFNLGDISFSPEQQFRMSEWAEVQLVIRARKALLDALRHYDRWANNTDLEIEERLVEERGLADIAELYTHMLTQTTAFERGGHLGNEGDNYAVSFNDIDHHVKQTTVDLVVRDILLTEREFEEITAQARRRLGRGLASLIAAESSEDVHDTDT